MNVFSTQSHGVCVLNNKLRELTCHRGKTVSDNKDRRAAFCLEHKTSRHIKALSASTPDGAYDYEHFTTVSADVIESAMQQKSSWLLNYVTTDADTGQWSAP